MADERRQALTRIIGERLSNCFGLGTCTNVPGSRKSLSNPPPHLQEMLRISAWP